MQYHKFSFPYTELFPESRELYEIIGKNGDDGTFSLVEEDFEILKKEISPDAVAEGGFFITSDFNIKDNSLTALDKKFQPEKIILKQIQKSSSLAFFICTAGYSISNYSKDCMNNGNPLRGYIADMTGSMIVEKCMDKGEEILLEMLYKNNLKITNRFSPGYCGWNTIEQHKLFDLFPPEFCGVTLTSSALMQPIKSISGIIGIGENVKKKGYTCSFCKDIECFYRKT
ncbi:MAG: vitamin B12 dependent-methionine synthase activation domain-containing protein [Bacteroidota bacterium]